VLVYLVVLELHLSNSSRPRSPLTRKMSSKNGHWSRGAQLALRPSCWSTEILQFKKSTWIENPKQREFKVLGLFQKRRVIWVSVCYFLFIGEPLLGLLFQLLSPLDQWFPNLNLFCLQQTIPIFLRHTKVYALYFIGQIWGPWRQTHYNFLFYNLVALYYA
jgi:hypothetical protein